MSGKLLGPRGQALVNDLLRQTPRQRPGAQPAARPMPRPGSPESLFATVTNATPDADGWCEATLQRYNVATDTWQNLGDCLVKEANA